MRLRISMDREKARQVLDLFLFEDIINNYNHYEGEYDITYVGDHFAVLEYSTGQVETFKVELVPSDLPKEEWEKAFQDQEWEEYMEEKVDKD